MDSIHRSLVKTSYLNTGNVCSSLKYRRALSADS